MIDLGTALGIGGSLLGGLFGGGGGSSEAAEDAKDIFWKQFAATGSTGWNAYGKMYDITNQALNYAKPYYTAGTNALNNLTNALTTKSTTDMVSGLPPGAGADVFNYLTQTPFYQALLQEGQKGLQNSLVAKGMGLSGAAGKELLKWNQNYAAANALNPTLTNYQNYLKNIAGLSGAGQNAANTLTDTTLRGGALQLQPILDLMKLQGGSSSTLNTGLAAQAAGGNDNNLSSILGGFGTLLGSIPWGKIGNALGIGGGASNIGSNYANALSAAWY